MKRKKLTNPSAGTQLAFRRVATALAVLSIGALATGAVAIGALAIRRLALGTGRIGRLSIDDLEVGKLRVRESITELDSLDRTKDN
ncbi:MAG: hypothetical protein P8017_17530 [Deltaproteobacteria bacterium]|jgi:hypothetical protein